tara:strand:+ start:2433 stop:3692 length:1260 start_codon:yes stop_codon:yes gene_type:complete
MGWGRKYFTGYRDPEVWAEVGLMGDSLSFTTDETVTKLGIGYIKDQRAECPMDTAIRFTLLNAGENGEITAKQMLNHHTRLASLFEAGLVADGWYIDDEGKRQRGWVFHKDGVRLHWNRITSHYARNQTHFPASFIGSKELWRYDTGWSGRSFKLSNSGYMSSDYRKIWESEEGFQPVHLKGHERALANSVDDKEVLKHINKSLNRMVKSGKAIQVTAGRGRTFRWNKWGWLDEYRQKHLVSVAKQRKLGDVVNGWVYTKGQVTEQYGVEICSHEWEPVEPVFRYTVKHLSPYVYQSGQWNGNGYELVEYIDWSSVALPYFFTDEAEALEVAEELNGSAFPRKGMSVRVNGQIVAPKHTVSKHEVTMRVKGDADIEDYMEPLEMYKRIQLGNFQIADELNDLLINNIKKKYGSIIQKEE